MDLFIQLMKTSGVSEEIQQEIIYQKNKNIIKNKNNLIWELQQYISIAKEDIYQYYESIEDFNLMMETNDDLWGNSTPRFYDIILMKIFNYEYYDDLL